QVGPCEIQIRIIDPTTASSGGGTVAPATLPSIERAAPPSPRPMAPTMPPRISVSSGGSGCDRRIGFLFPRRCGRLSSAGCPHCDDGRVAEEPYFTYSHERSLYPDYGNYAALSWGNRGYSDADVDFTEADAASLELLGDDFEQDMGAS
ncbi:MAG: hypothetical protein AAFQ89_12625, partial [Cyanobacteria bacterium J06626_18]